MREAASEPTAGDPIAARFTERLRLVPIGPDGARDLWSIHNEDEVAAWYGPAKPTIEEVEAQARMMGWSWRILGAHKWLAYELLTGELVGRGGVSRTPVDDDWGQIYAFLPDQPWARQALDVGREVSFHAAWVEIGWALRPEFWGRGYASEIGRAGLEFAFRELDSQAVVACTERHNARSRAVMARIGLHYAGEIRSRGSVEGVEGERDDAPFAVSVLLRSDVPATGP